MPNGKDAFEERLMRLGQDSKTSAQAASPAAAPVPQPEPQVRSKPRGSGGSGGLAILAVAMLLVGGGAFAIMLFAPDIVFSTEALE